MIDRLLGRLLRGRHAGEEHLLDRDLRLASNAATIELTSTAFEPGALIPLRYAGEGVGENVSPPLAWSNVPDDAVELALSMEDPDAPLRRPFVHLVAACISPSASGVPEGSLNASSFSKHRELGLTTFRKLGYGGPRALPGHGPHTYVFQVFALARKSGLRSGMTRADVLRALQDNVLAYGELRGVFEQK
jgi:Raf kinase inhibitor-like YbhB/YbcL family protein